MKRFIKAILPKPVLAELVDVLGRARLFTVAKRKFDPANLKSSADLSLDQIFSDQATKARWKVDHTAIKAIFGDDDLYGGINPGDRRALYHLISAFKPGRVLEIGTHIGASTLYISVALKSIGKGNATTVDVLDVNAPTGPWKKAGLNSPPRDFVQQLKCSDYIEFVTQPSLGLMSTTKERFDFIFLDGDHSPRAVYLEMAAALLILKPDGVILLHDYYQNGKPLFPDGNIISGPFRAMQRVQKECPEILVQPLGELPWSTKQGTNITSLALVTCYCLR